MVSDLVNDRRVPSASTPRLLVTVDGDDDFLVFPDGDCSRTVPGDDRLIRLPPNVLDSIVGYLGKLLHLRCQCPVMAFDDIIDFADDQVEGQSARDPDTSTVVVVVHRKPPPPLPLRSVEIDAAITALDAWIEGSWRKALSAETVAGRWIGIPDAWNNHAGNGQVKMEAFHVYFCLPEPSFRLIYLSDG